MITYCVLKTGAESDMNQTSVFKKKKKDRPEANC